MYLCMYIIVYSYVCIYIYMYMYKLTPRIPKWVAACSYSICAVSISCVALCGCPNNQGPTTWDRHCGPRSLTTPL